MAKAEFKSQSMEEVRSAYLLIGKVIQKIRSRQISQDKRFHMTDYCVDKSRNYLNQFFQKFSAKEHTL
jgi:hypothetical protein